MPRNINLAGKAAKFRAFFRRHRRMPGYGEMMAMFGYRSKHAVFAMLNRMAKAGYISKSGGKIAPGNRMLARPRLLGSVQAGFPSPAEEDSAETLSLDEFLVHRPEVTYMLTVSGDSMIEAGIHPGDIVLVERGAVPKRNDIVVAQVDGEWTLKYFVKDEAGVRLLPANAKYSAIIPRQSLLIGGVVRAVVRKYT